MDKLTQADINHMNPAVLASVGDAAFLLYVRTHLATTHDLTAGELAKQTKRFVCAKAQSSLLNYLKPMLSAVESDVVRTARNRHTKTKAKNAGLSDYRRATGFEALVGYLYLSGQTQRLSDIQAQCFAFLDNAPTDNQPTDNSPMDNPSIESVIEKPSGESLTEKPLTESPTNPSAQEPPALND